MGLMLILFIKIDRISLQIAVKIKYIQFIKILKIHNQFLSIIFLRYLYNSILLVSNDYCIIREIIVYP